MSSLWSAIARALPFKRRLPVGTDLAGNKYFEFPNPNGGRAKRVVEYAEEATATSPGLDYRQGTQQLPVQWTAWMSYTRLNPPTVAELQADAARLARLAPLVARIEARERAERIQQGFLLPDGTEPGGHEGAKPLVPSGLQALRVSRPPDAPVDPQEFPTDAPLAPPRTKVNPESANTGDELRALAEEDTRRRLRESGVREGTGEGLDVIEDVGSGFKPRRRG